MTLYEQKRFDNIRKNERDEIKFPTFDMIPVHEAYDWYLEDEISKVQVNFNSLSLGKKKHPWSTVPLALREIRNFQKSTAPRVSCPPCSNEYKITNCGYLRNHKLPSHLKKIRGNTKTYGTTTVTNLSHKLQLYIYKSLYDDVIGELKDNINFDAMIPLFSDFSIN